MLTQIRRVQKGLLIIVTIIIVFAFAFLYSDYDFAKVGKDDCVFRVYGKCYRLKEAKKLQNSLQVASQFGMREFVSDLFERDRQDDDPSNFILSLVILRKEAERLGIEPSFEEIQEAIPELPALKAQPWMNQQIVESILSSNGFSMGDFQELVGDYLAWQKLRDLVSAGLQPVPSEMDRMYKYQFQRYNVAVVDFEQESFKEKVNPSDEDIQKFYDQNGEFLNSELKRGFEMIRFVEGELPETATNEEKSNAALEFRKSVNIIYKELAGNPDEFMKLAKAQENAVAVNQVEVKTIDAFSRSEIPDLLKEEFQTVAGLFSGAVSAGSVSQPFSLEDGSTAVFKISEEIPPQPLTVEEAREEIVTELKRRDSNQMANDAASEARQKLLDAVKAGKSIEEAATDAGLKTRVIPNFSQTEPPAAEVDDGNVIAYAVRGVAPGELSTVTQKQTGYLLAFVDKVELYEDSTRESRERILGSSQNRQDVGNLFTAWLNQKRAESNAIRPSDRRIIPQENLPVSEG